MNYFGEMWNSFICLSWLCNLLNWHMKNTCRSYCLQFWGKILDSHNSQKKEPMETFWFAWEVWPNSTTSHLQARHQLPLFCCFCSNWTLHLICRGNTELQGASRGRRRETDPSALYTWGGTEWKHEPKYCPMTTVRVLRIMSCLKMSALWRVKVKQAKDCTIMKNCLFFKEVLSHFSSLDNTSVFNRFSCQTNAFDYSKTSVFFTVLLIKEWKIFYKNGTINSHFSIQLDT